MAELSSSGVLAKQDQKNKEIEGRIANLEALLKIQCLKIDLDFGAVPTGTIASQQLPDDQQAIFNQMRAEHVIGGCYTCTSKKDGSWFLPE